VRVRGLLVTLALVVLAGCGGADDDASRDLRLQEPTATPATATPGAPAGPDDPASGGADAGQPSTRAAVLAVAARATSALLSYDHRTMDAVEARARRFLTPAYAGLFREQLAQARENAATTGASAKVEVLAAGLSGFEEDTAAALVLARVTTRAAGSTTATVNAARLRLVRRDGRWLVDGIGNDETAKVFEPDAVRRQVMARASAFVTALSTFDAPGYRGYVAGLEPLVTDDYLGTIRASVDALAATGATASSTVTVDATAVQRLSGDRARVLVSVGQSMTTAAGSQSQQGRMVVDLRRAGGTWRAAAVQTLS
jgi:hypothetical protein